MSTKRKRKAVAIVWRWTARLGFAALLLMLVLVVPLRWLPPPTTAFIWRDAMVADKWVWRDWTPMDAMSSELAIAVVSAEDQKFPHHHGFDLDAIREAMSEERERRRGASTITQQLAKNLYLWPGRSWLRKALEAVFTITIELAWPKQRILEVYLNVVEFAPGTYGAARASEALFAKPVKAISRREAALLAAVLPNPKRLSAAHPSPYVRARARHIAREIRNLGGHDYLPWLELKR